MREYDFPDIRDELEDLKKEIEISGFTDEVLERCFVLENTITSLESTRYPGNSYLMSYQKETEELIDSETKANIPKALICYLIAPIAAGLIVGELIWPLTESKFDKQMVCIAAEQPISVEEIIDYTLPREDPAQLDYSDEESQMLLKLAMAEAEDQGITGKALVMNVVRNRVLSDEFPSSIEDVVFQEVTEDTHQFSVIDDGRYDEAIPDEECYEALRMVLDYWDASNGTLYFEAEWNENTWHRDNLDKLFQYEDLIFYK